MVGAIQSMMPLSVADRMKLGGLFGERLKRDGLQFNSFGEMEEYSAPNKLMLDFDRRRTPKMGGLFVLLRMCGLRVKHICDTRSRRGWHRVITLTETLGKFEIIAIQALAGSDRRREGLNLMRALRSRECGMSRFQESRWNILYSRKL